MTTDCQQLDLLQLSIVHNMPTVNSHECSEIVCRLSHRFTRDSSLHVNESINCSLLMLSLYSTVLITYVVSIMVYVFVS